QEMRSPHPAEGMYGSLRHLVKPILEKISVSTRTWTASLKPTNSSLVPTSLKTWYPRSLLLTGDRSRRGRASAAPHATTRQGTGIQPQASSGPHRAASQKPRNSHCPAQGFVAETWRDNVVNYVCWDRAGIQQQLRAYGGRHNGETDRENRASLDRLERTTKDVFLVSILQVREQVVSFYVSFPESALNASIALIVSIPRHASMDGLSLLSSSGRDH